MTEVKGLVCGAYEDAPFADSNDLVKGGLSEVDYYSEAPFVCLTELGAALFAAVKDAGMSIAKVSLAPDRKEPMNIYDLDMEAADLKLHISWSQYMRPGRGLRPPQSKNRSQFPWGYSATLDVSGDDCACATFLTNLLIRLKRNPWDGIVWEEFPVRGGCTQDAAKKAWLQAIYPIYEECQKRIASATDLKLDTKELDLQLQEAKAALDGGRTDYFLSLMKKMDFTNVQACVEEQRKKGQDLSKMVLAVQERLKEASALGLDTTNPEHYLSNAKRALLNKRWDEAKDGIKKAEDTIGVLRKASRPDIKLRLVCPNNAVTGKPLPFALELANTGNLPAMDMRVEFEGELKFEFLDPPSLLPPGHTARIDATARAAIGGFKDLGAGVRYSRSFDGQPYDAHTSSRVYFADSELKIRSDARTEVAGGLVRLELEFVNEYLSDITDVRLELLQDQEALELIGIEPPMDFSKGAFLMGTLRPKEGRKVAALFDPQLSRPAQVKGSMSFVDIKGQPRHFLFSTEALAQVAINCVVGNIPSAKSLVEQFATTHHQEFNKIYALPMGLTAKTAYRVARNCAMALPASQVLEEQGGESANGPLEAIEGQSWYSVQDQEPGNSCLVYLRAWQGLGALQVLAASPDSAYSRCLLLNLQAIIEAQLTDLGMMEKDQRLRQLPCGYLRDQIASIKLGMLDTVELGHTDMASRVHKAATSRESACSSLRELELRAGKELADKGRVKRRGA